MEVHLLQVMCQPDCREGALAELPNNLVLTVVEDIAEMDGMVATRVVVLHPLTRGSDGFEPPLMVLWGPRRRRQGRGAHDSDRLMTSFSCPIECMERVVVVR